MQTVARSAAGFCAARSRATAASFRAGYGHKEFDSDPGSSLRWRNDRAFRRGRIGDTLPRHAPPSRAASTARRRHGVTESGVTGRDPDPGRRAPIPDPDRAPATGMTGGAIPLGAFARTTAGMPRFVRSRVWAAFGDCALGPPGLVDRRWGEADACRIRAALGNAGRTRPAGAPLSPRLSLDPRPPTGDHRVGQGV